MEISVISYIGLFFCLSDLINPSTLEMTKTTALDTICNQKHAILLHLHMLSAIKPVYFDNLKSKYP